MLLIHLCDLIRQASICPRLVLPKTIDEVPVFLKIHSIDPCWTLKLTSIHYKQGGISPSFPIWICGGRSKFTLAAYGDRNSQLNELCTSHLFFAVATAGIHSVSAECAFQAECLQSSSRQSRLKQCLRRLCLQPTGKTRYGERRDSLIMGLLPSSL